MFCDGKGFDPFSPIIKHIVDFLASLYHSGLGYSAINTARSALSSFCDLSAIQVPVGQHHLVKRFMRGVFLLRPTLPRHNVTWDVNKVLMFIEQITLNASLKQITMKVAMLLCLLSGQRLQSVHLIDIRNIEFTENCVKIRIGDLVKQSRPGHHIEELIFNKYANNSLCIVTYLHKYLLITKTLRKAETSLFISFYAPHKKVTKDTISRWIKTVLKDSGIDTSIFKPHSVRAASVSKANNARLPLETILRTAGWSKESTFRKFYNKPITNDTSFAETILEKSKHSDS